MTIRILILIVIASLVFSAKSQNTIDDIDLSRIPQKKVRKYIINQKNNKIRFLNDFRLTYKNGDDTSAYRIVNKIYLMKDNLSSVWESYLINDMAQMWNGKIVSFGMSVSRPTQSVCYRNEGIVKPVIGQILFLNLKLFKGIYNLAAAFEITEIDSIKKTIVFNYVEGGKSMGTQIIKFKETSDGFTEIEHKTFFRSNSKFRDKRLYPFFHIKAIDEFHENVLKARNEKADVGNT